MDDFWKPRILDTGYERFENARGKFYRGRFRVRNVSRYTRRRFKTAMGAELYALAVRERYGRLLASRPIPQSLPHVEGE